MASKRSDAELAADITVQTERHDWLKAAARRVHRTVDAADVTIRAVERSEMEPEHARLDQLLE